MNEKASAFDLATTSGVAFGPFGGTPQGLTWKLGKGSHGERGLELMRLGLAHLKEFQPELVFIEEPLGPRILVDIGATTDTAMLLPGLVVVMATVCASLNIPYVLLSRQAVLHHFTGRARYQERIDGKDAAKKACVARCAQLGWKPDGYDEADGMALWDYGCVMNFSRAAQVMMDRPAPRLGLPEPTISRPGRSRRSRTVKPGSSLPILPGSF